MGYDGSLRIIYASGLDSHYQTEPHVLAGTANPTVAKRNMTLPGENGQNLVEWRFRKEQAQGKVNVFGRKLRVSMCQRRAGDGRQVSVRRRRLSRGQTWAPRTLTPVPHSLGA